MLTIQELEAMLEANILQLKRAWVNGNTQEIFQLNTANHEIKNSLIDAYKSQLSKVG
jgi:hypothetical protein